MNEKGIKFEKEGECSKFIQYDDDTWSFETKYRDYRVDTSSYAKKAITYLTIFGLIDAFNEIKENYYDKFEELLRNATSLKDFDDLEKFLEDNEGKSNLVDDFIDNLQAYIEAYKNIFIINENKEINENKDLEKFDLDSLDSLLNKKETLDMLANELHSKQYVDPEEYFILARDYDNLSFDLERLVKFGRVKEEKIEEINNSCKFQSNNLKKSANKIEELDDIIKSI